MRLCSFGETKYESYSHKSKAKLRKCVAQVNTLGSVAATWSGMTSSSWWLMLAKVSEIDIVFKMTESVHQL